MPIVVHVTVLEPYKLRLVFDDGRVKTVDLESRLWGPVFEPLRNAREFAQVRVDPVLGTIVWPNGADFSPEFLYDYEAEVGSPAMASATL